MIEQKQAVRRRMLEVCRQIPQAQLEAASEEIAAKVMEWVRMHKPKTVFCYVSYRKEIQTQHLLQQLHRAGCRVYVPYVTGGEMLAVRWTPSTPMDKNRWGIPEPTVQQALAEPLELIVLPGVAFGKDGTRLGYGGGYYDRFMQVHPCMRIGICGSWQLLDSVPTQPHDLSPHAIFCEKRQITFTSKDISTKI